MRIVGTRADGTQWVTLDGGMAVLLRADRCSPPVDPHVIEGLGPWTFAAVVRDGDEQRVLVRRLERARTVALHTFFLGDAEGHPFRGNQWTDGTGGGGGESKDGSDHHPSLTEVQRSMQEAIRQQRSKPVHEVKTTEEAVNLILKGENVELADTRQVHTVLKLLAEKALEAQAAGGQAKNWDPCTVTVKGASIFCQETLKTEKFKEGIPRIEMPQFKSKNPIPGSAADKLPRDANGEVNAAQAFLAHLRESGVKTHPDEVLSRKLKASQAEMEGTKVAGMMLNPHFDPKSEKNRIWVSRDNYVIDGHHTWAAAVGRDAEDGNLNNDAKMKVTVVDMPMSQIYHLSTEWTRKLGIPPAGVKK